MTHRLTAITRKGRITIPADYRRAVAIAEGDDVAVALEDGRMRIIPYGSVTARTAGMLRGEGPVLSAEQMRDTAEQAITDSAMQRSSGDSVVDRTAGIFKGSKPISTTESERAAFERLVAEEVVGSGED